MELLINLFHSCSFVLKDSFPANHLLYALHLRIPTCDDKTLREPPLKNNGGAHHAYCWFSLSSHRKQKSKPFHKLSPESGK